MDAPALAFKSPEELEQLLRHISLRLHYINRVSGESNFLWSLAELIAAAGRLAPLTDDNEVSKLFGSGYDPSKLSDEERQDLILAYLRDRMSA